MDEMNYPIVIHKDKDSDYGVTVPDLPGCFSAGSTLDEAIEMAREAIELHLEGLIEEGQVVPEPNRIERHQKNPDFKGGTWAVVSIDPATLRLSAKRVNITLPQRILDAIDRHAESSGQTRSGALAKAAVEYIARHSARPRARTKAALHAGDSSRRP
jgi:predicted RNase H-like HicB family nuclease